MLLEMDMIVYAAYDVARALKIGDVEKARRAVTMEVIKEDDYVNLLEWNGKTELFVGKNIVISLALKYCENEELKKRFISYLIKTEFYVKSDVYLANAKLKNTNDNAKRLYENGNNEPSKSHSIFAISQIAKMYGMSGKELNRKLNELRIQYKVNDQWVLYSKYQNLGLTVALRIKKSNSDETTLHTYWTEKGLQFIINILDGLGYKRNNQLELKLDQ